MSTVSLENSRKFLENSLSKHLSSISGIMVDMSFFDRDVGFLRLLGCIVVVVGFVVPAAQAAVGGPSSREHSRSTHEGPVPPIESGFGRWGNAQPVGPEDFTVETQGSTNTVSVYYPQDQTTAAPTLFFAVGWDVPCPVYEELFRFFASRGYVAVCSEYDTETETIGAQLKDAFLAAAARYPTRIDTGYIGLAGHSAGAGLLNSLAWDLVRNEGWGGSDGEHTFIFSSAPWFDFDITDAKLTDFPDGVKVILLTNEDDHGTDYRTYIDQFESLPIEDDEKDYIILRTSVVEGYTYQTDHMLIGTQPGYGASVFDAMDDYGVFRLIDALAAYTFFGDMTGWRVALGDGSEEQLDMGPLRDLISTDDPRPVPGQGSDYPCDVDINPRRDRCDDYDDQLPASVLISPVKYRTISRVHVHFAWEPSPTATTYFLQLRPVLDNGEPDWTISYGETVDASTVGCSSGEPRCEHTSGFSIPDDAYIWWILPSNAELGGAWSRRGSFSVETVEQIFADNFQSGDLEYWDLAAGAETR